MRKILKQIYRNYESLLKREPKMKETKPTQPKQPKESNPPNQVDKGGRKF